jgi:hypothetical protein
MAYAVSYQLINNTGSQLNLVGTNQYPSSWLPAAPTTIAAGGKPLISNNSPSGQIGVTIVFGYSIAGSAVTQFWVLSTVDDLGPHAVQIAPSSHSITVNIEGDSEDGWLVTLTYK